MTPREIELVQRTFARAARIGPHVAATFYAELFAIDPAVRSLFKADMIAQGEKLMATLAHIVGGLGAEGANLPLLRELALRHVSYGVESRHYTAVGTALMRTLKHELGADFTAEARAAWTAAYQQIADVMREAAYGTEAAARQA